MTPSTPSHQHTHRRRRRHVFGGERLFLILGFLFLAAAILPAIGARAQSGDAETVVVIPISGTIEPGIGHFLERAINEAESANATTIILDINTPGGRLDTVLEMRGYILDTEIPVVAF